jgi:hypothetical protein
VSEADPAPHDADHGPVRTWPDIAGSAYHDLIDGQLERENARKDSFESRGISMITSAGTIVTLLFGLAALTTKTSDFTLKGGAKTALVVALCFLLSSAVAGVVVNAPLQYSEADPGALMRLLDEQFWWGDPAIGRRRTAELEIKQVARARKMNSLKARLLVAGLAAEILGVLAVAAAVLQILT